ncbi:hypothetical protein [Tumidithrix helvetica]
MIILRNLFMLLSYWKRSRQGAVERTQSQPLPQRSLPNLFGLLLKMALR